MVQCLPEDVPIVVELLPALEEDDVKALVVALPCESTVLVFIVVTVLTAPVSRSRVGVEVDPLTVTGPQRFAAGRATCTACLSQLTTAALPPL